LALAVPLSRFTPRVGGGSAFVVRPLNHTTKTKHQTIMKFSNGTELRFGRAKYSKLTIRLLGVGGIFGILSWFIGAPAKDWLSGIGLLAFAAGLVVLLAGTIAERKEWQAAHRRDFG
jgi:hypothetical protein